MTGLSETQHVVEGLKAGGVDYVTKPIVMDELMARIRVHLAIARVAHGTRSALDATGRFLIATDDDGRLIWSTLQAETLLRAAFPERDIVRDGLPDGLTRQLASLIETVRQHHAGFQEISIAGQRQLKTAYVSSIERNEHLFRLTEECDNQQNEVLRQQFALTLREAEVLLWLARGKSNRDIAEILGISPRTVNKHVEQVFNKLDVDNRASATAQATKVLALHV
jgi:DNA-binding CsgD family transcriptional regulator